MQWFLLDKRATGETARYHKHLVDAASGDIYVWGFLAAVALSQVYHLGART